MPAEAPAAGTFTEDDFKDSAPAAGTFTEEDFAPKAGQFSEADFDWRSKLPQRDPMEQGGHQPSMYSSGGTVPGVMDTTSPDWGMARTIAKSAVETTKEVGKDIGAAWTWANKSLLPETDPVQRLRENVRQFGLEQEVSPTVPGDVAEAPLLTGKPAAIATGVWEGVSELPTFFTTPLGVATLGTGYLPKAAQKLVALGFTIQMAHAVPEVAKELGAELGKPEGERDHQKIAKLITVGATTTGFTLGSALHAAHTADAEPFINREAPEPDVSREAPTAPMSREAPAPRFDVPLVAMPRTAPAPTIAPLPVTGERPPIEGSELPMPGGAEPGRLPVFVPEDIGLGQKLEQASEAAKVPEAGTFTAEDFTTETTTKGEPNAIEQEQQQGGIPPERAGGNAGGQAAETGGGDSLQRPAPRQEPSAGTTQAVTPAEKPVTTVTTEKPGTEWPKFLTNYWQRNKKQMGAEWHPSGTAFRPDRLALAGLSEDQVKLAVNEAVARGVPKDFLLDRSKYTATDVAYRDIINAGQTGADVAKRAQKLMQERFVGVTRHAGDLSSEHIERVAARVPDDQPVLKAIAYLHDIVEDTPTKLEEIRARFGDRIADAIDAETWRKDSETYFQYIERLGKNMDAVQSKLADIADNIEAAKGWGDTPKAVAKVIQWKEAQERLQRILDGKVDLTHTIERKVMPDGTPRETWRHEQIRKLLTLAANVPPGEQKEIIYMGGGPGSGKSSVKRHAIASGEISDHAKFTISADDFKTGKDEVERAGAQGIPEFWDFIKAGVKEAAWLVHKESTFMAKAALARLVEEGKSGFYDATMSNHKEDGALVIAAKNAGYKTTLMGVWLRPDEAVRRAKIREAQIGRGVPERSIREGNRGFRDAFPVYLNLFDDVELYDNNGKTPRLILSKTAKKGIEIFDQKAYDEFAGPDEQQAAKSETEKPAQGEAGGGDGSILAGSTEGGRREGVRGGQGGQAGAPKLAGINPDEQLPNSQDSGGGPGRSQPAITGNAGAERPTGEDDTGAAGVIPPGSGEHDEGAAGKPKGGRKGKLPSDADNLPPVRQPNAPDIGATPGGGAGGGQLRGPGVEGVKPNPDGSNLRLSENPAPTGAVARVKANIDAIKLLKKLADENRIPTDEERKTLAAWSGWGSFKEMFAEGKAARREYETSWNARYGKFYDQLRKLLTDEEFEAAQESSVNAHYTSKQVVDFMWNLARRLGFTGGRVLEPGAGSGLFMGYQPDDLAANTSWSAIEMDLITGKVLAHLYPQADVRVQGFEDAKLPNGFYDMAITNVPFHEVGPGKEYPELNLHNYFLARSLDKVKPGGLVIAISTKNTMEARPKQRELLAGKGQLIGAVRLPNNAFKESAATEVVTDILVFRKPDGKAFPGEKWGSRVEVGRENDKPIEVNEYFARHPEMVLGEHALTGSMYGADEYTVTGRGDLQPKLDRALKAFPQDVMTELATEAPVEMTQLENGSLRVSPSGQVLEARNFKLEAPLWDSNNPTLVRRAKDYIALRDALKAQYKIEDNPESTDAEIAASRKALVKAYDAWVKHHGRLSATELKTKHLRDDPDYWTVQGLESVKEEPDPKNDRKTLSKIIPADVLSKRVRMPDVPPTSAKDANDALGVSMAYKGNIDLDYMQKLTGQSRAALESELLAANVVFRDPDTARVELVRNYLSGDVRDKLAKAIFAAKEDPQYQRNVDALKAVVPPIKPFAKIKFQIGARWVPDFVYSQFAQEIIGLSEGAVKFVPRIEEFAVGGATGRKARITSNDQLAKWNTPSLNAVELLNLALNNKRARVMVQVDKNKYREDTTASGVANQKIDQMREAFEKWSRTTDSRIDFRKFDEERGQYVKEPTRVADIMEREWNRLKESHVLPAHDGSKLKLPGVNRDYFWARPHVLSGIQRMITDGSGYFAHGVGSGKTLLYIVGANELKRIGLAKKPILVVKKPTVEQYRVSIANAYPGKRVLIPDQSDFDKSNRRALIGKIASSNYDFIVLTHEQMRSIRPSEGAVAGFFNEQIEALRSLLKEMGQADAENSKSTRGMSSEVRNVVRQLKTLKKKLSENLEKIKKHHDVGLNWEDLGVDAIFLDEAHNFKRMPITTGMDGVKGIPSGFSQRAVDLLVKLRDVQHRTNGRNVFFASGTPISNTLAELWLGMYAINPKLLDEFGVSTFDSFATAFADITTDFEFGWDNQFHNVTRMSKFKNGGALSSLVRAGMDVKIGNKELGLDVPEMEGGSPQVVGVPVNPEFQRWMTLVEDVAAQWNGLEPKERFENSWVAITTMRAGAAAALDPRCIFPDAVDHPDSKVNTAVRDIFKEWQDGKERRTTMMVFADLYRTLNTTKLRGFIGDNRHLATDHTETGDDAAPELPDTADAPDKDAAARQDDADFEANAVGSFNVYNDIRDKLVKLGVPKDEIGVITEHDTDVKRNALFDKVRSGAVRILIGGTEKIGEGVDVPQRMSAEFHLDPPMQMTPAKMEQRIGRIIRQGNLHASKNWNLPVRVKMYAQERSMDAAIYNMLLRKGKMVTQALKGEFLGDEFDDPATEMSATLAELVANATGDKRALEAVRLQETVRKLQLEESVFIREQGDLKSQIESNSYGVRNSQQRAAKSQTMAEAMEKATADPDAVKLRLGKLEWAGWKAIDAGLEKLQPQFKDALDKSVSGHFERTFSLGDNLYVLVSGHIMQVHNKETGKVIRHEPIWRAETYVSEDGPKNETGGLPVSYSDINTVESLPRVLKPIAGRARAAMASELANSAHYEQMIASYQKALAALHFDKGDELAAKKAQLEAMQSSMTTAQVSSGAAMRKARRAGLLMPLPPEGKNLTLTAQRMHAFSELAERQQEFESRYQTDRETQTENIRKWSAQLPGLDPKGWEHTQTTRRIETAVDHIKLADDSHDHQLEQELKPLMDRLKRIEREMLDEARKGNEDTPAIIGMGGAVSGEFERTGTVEQQLAAQIRSMPRHGGSGLGGTAAAVRVAGALATGKTRLQRWWLANVAAGQQVKRLLFGPPPLTGSYWGVKAEWVKNQQVNEADALALLKAGRAQFPKQLHRQAMGKYAQALMFPDPRAKLQEWAAASGPAARRQYEAALLLDTAAQSAVLEAIRYYERKGEELQAAGLLSSLIEDYAGQHMVDHAPNEDLPAAFNGLRAELDGGKLNTNFRYSLRRMFETEFDLERAGYRLKTTDLFDKLANYGKTANNVLAARAAVKAWMAGETSDGRPLFATGVGRRVVEGEGNAALLVNPKVRPNPVIKNTAGERVDVSGEYVKISHPAFKKWQWVETDESGRQTFVSGDVWAHRSIAPDLKNTLGHSMLYDIPGVDTATKVNAFAKGIKLVGLFHQVKTGSHALFHLTLPWGMPEIDPHDVATQSAMRNGLLLYEPNSMEVFSEGVSSSPVLHRLPLAGPVMRQYQEYLFQNYIPRVKLATYRNALERNRARYSSLTAQQLEQITAEQVNNAFGLKNWKLIGTNPTFHHFLRLALLAPDFQAAQTGFAAQTFGKYGGEQRMAAAIMIASVYTVARILNQIFDKDPHFELKRAFGVVYHGREYGMRTVASDVVRAFTDVSQFVYHRLAPIPSAIFENIAKQDALGRKETGLQALGNTALRFVPMPITPRSDLGFVESALTSTLGLYEKRASDVADVRAMGKDWLKKSGTAKEKAAAKEQEQSSYPESHFETLQRALQDGNNAAAAVAYQKLLAGGTSVSDVLHHFSPQRPIATGNHRQEMSFRMSLKGEDLKRYARAKAELLLEYQRLNAVMNAPK